MFQFVILSCLAALVVCGQPQSHNPRSLGRIVGGEDVCIDDIPYQASLQLLGKHHCGATIISDKFVITAALCVYEQSAGELSVRVGSSAWSFGGLVITVKEVTIHPSFDSYSLDYDVAVLELSEKLEFISGVGSIRLPVADESAQVGAVATLSGWGTTSEEGTALSTFLQAVDVKIVSSVECQEQYGDYPITDRMLCAGVQEGGKGPCGGDAGSPLVVNRQAVGIVSWGISPAPRLFAHLLLRFPEYKV